MAFMLTKATFYIPYFQLRYLKQMTIMPLHP